MSAIGTYDVDCQCGNHMTVCKENSANLMDRKVIEKIITGEIMEASCPKCGRKHFLNRPVLYSDIGTGEFVWYLPNGHEQINSKLPGIKTINISDYREFRAEVAKRTGVIL